MMLDAKGENGSVRIFEWMTGQLGVLDDVILNVNLFTSNVL